MRGKKAHTVFLCIGINHASAVCTAHNLKVVLSDDRLNRPDWGAVCGWKWCESYAMASTVTRCQTERFLDHHQNIAPSFGHFILQIAFVTNLITHMASKHGSESASSVSLLLRRSSNMRTKRVKVYPWQPHWSFRSPLSKLNWKQSTGEPAHWPDPANNSPWPQSRHTCWQRRERQGEREKSLIKLFEFDRQ